MNSQKRNTGTFYSCPATDITAMGQGARRRFLTLGMVLLFGWGVIFSTPTFAAAFQSATEVVRIKQDRAKRFPYKVEAFDLYSVNSLDNLSMVPIRVKVTATTPVVKDQDFYIGVSNREMYSGSSNRVYQTKVTMKKGQSELLVDIPFESEQGQNVLLTVSVDGRYSADVRPACIGAYCWSNGSNGSRSSGLNMGYFSDLSPLVSSSPLPSVLDKDPFTYRYNPTAVNHIVDQTGNSKQIPHLTAMYQGVKVDYFESLPKESQKGTIREMTQWMLPGRELEVFKMGTLQDLSDDWQVLNSLPVIIIPEADMRKLRKQYPAKLEGLRKWVTAGGTLVVSGCGDDWAGLSRVSRCFKPSSLDEKFKKKWTWNYFDRTELQSKQRRGNRKGRSNPQGATYFDEYGNAIDVESFEQKEPDWTDKVEVKQFAIGDPAPTETVGRKVSVMFRSFGEGKIIALSRKSDDWRPGDWFLVWRCKEYVPVWRKVGTGFVRGRVPSGFAILSVGQPPVVAFVFLIFIFSIVVGPVFYFTLNRFRRVQWLVAIIPIFSIFVSILLLVFTLVKDGVNLKSKRVSVTKIDQTSGVQINQTIQTLFQGVSPGSYEFEKDTMTFLAGPGSGYPRTRADQKSRYLSGAGIAARTKHQVTTVRPAFTKNSVDFQKRADGVWTAKNLLGTKIEKLVTNIEGEFYWAENLDNDKEAVLQPFDDQWRGWLSDERSSLIENCYKEGASRQFDNRDRFNRYSSSERYNSIGGPLHGGTRGSAKNGFNSSWGWVGVACSVVSAGVNNDHSNFKKVIQPREYFAICNDSPFAKTLSPSVSYEYQLHVIHGKW